MKDLLIALLLEASQLSGLSIPDAPLPRLQFADRCEIADLEHGMDVKCPAEDVPQAVAVYLDDRDLIVVNEEYKPHVDERNMVLVHELVHYLQDHHGILTKARANGCLQQAERLAYKVQFAWLKKHKLPRELAGIDNITLMFATTCDRR